jgi:hypothetical protein
MAMKTTLSIPSTISIADKATRANTYSTVNAPLFNHDVRSEPGANHAM